MKITISCSVYLPHKVIIIVQNHVLVHYIWALPETSPTFTCSKLV